MLSAITKTTTKPGMFLVRAVGLSKITFGAFFSVLVCKGRTFQSLSTVIDIVTVKGSVQNYCVTVTATTATHHLEVTTASSSL